jgi:tetratricopeptide (TPR) repeat protein
MYEIAKKRHPRMKSTDLKNSDEMFTTANKVLLAVCLLALLNLSGCAGIQVAGNVQAGRNALHTGRPNDAVPYFVQASAVDPAYTIPYRIPVGVLVYLGRAYYETGQDADARKSLEQALALDKDDPLAHLYLGLTLLRTGGREKGRSEIAIGLKGIHETLEYIASDNVHGIFWDPARMIRSDIEGALASQLDDSELAVAAARIGTAFEEEIDKARRDERERRGGGDSSGGQ